MRDSIKAILRSGSVFSERPFQVDTIEDAASFLKNNGDSVMIESPTGSGKTLMGIVTAVLAMKEIGGNKILWVAMRKKLLDQAMQTASMLGVRKYFEPVSMFSGDPPSADVIVVDEAHHDATASMVFIHKKVKPKKWIGLTATPIRQDRAELIFEKTVARAGIRELVGLGYLAKPDLYILPDWSPGTVCDCYVKNRTLFGRSVMFFYTKEECEEALAILQKEEVNAGFIHAKSDKESLYSDWDDGKIEVMINMILLTEGFDSPELETAFIRPSPLALTQQMGGRVLRPYEGIRKKIVQAQESPIPFGRIAPIGRSFKKGQDGLWKALDFDEETIKALVRASNSRRSSSKSLSLETSAALSLLKTGVSHKDKKEDDEEGDED